MALGGVATGSIKAREALTVAAITNKNGCTLIATATPATTGMIMAAVAVFEVNSVKNLARTTTKKMIKIIFIDFNIFNCKPIQFESPLTSKAFARAKPPPNRKITSHGNFTADFQSKTKMPFFQSTGIMNKTEAPTMAMVESRMVFGPKGITPCTIQSKATKLKTISTYISPIFILPNLAIS